MLFVPSLNTHSFKHCHSGMSWNSTCRRHARWPLTQTRAEARRVAPPQNGILLLRPALSLHHIGTPKRSDAHRPTISQNLPTLGAALLLHCCQRISSIHPAGSHDPGLRTNMSGFARFRFNGPVQDSSIRFFFVIRQYSTELNSAGPDTCVQCIFHTSSVCAAKSVLSSMLQLILLAFLDFGEEPEAKSSHTLNTKGPRLSANPGD